MQFSNLRLRIFSAVTTVLFLSSNVGVGAALEDIDPRKDAAANSIFSRAGMRNLVDPKPEVAGSWYVPPLPPKTDASFPGKNKMLHVGAIQATLLPSGKVLMVNGSSNRLGAVDFNLAPVAQAPETAIDPSRYEHVDATVLFDTLAVKPENPNVHGYKKIFSLPRNEIDKRDPNIELPNIDLFGGGNHPLPSGDALFIGGTKRYMNPAKTDELGKFWGINRTQIFSWQTETWEKAEDMKSGRWSPTLTELPDGKIFVFGGMDSVGQNSTLIEIFDPFTKKYVRTLGRDNSSAPMSPRQALNFSEMNFGGRSPRYPNNPLLAFNGAFDNYMRIFLMNDGRLFFTANGAAEGNRNADQKNTLYAKVNFLNQNNFDINFTLGPLRAGRFFDQRGVEKFATSRLYSTEVRDPRSANGDLMIFGGGILNYQNTDTSVETNENRDPDRKSVSSLEVFKAGLQPGALGSIEKPIDNALGDDEDPATRDPRSSGRLNLNSVILPTQQILVLGGGNTAYVDPLFHPVLFTPDASGKFNGYRRDFMNPFNFPRLYHNTTLLLPDGRVLIAGGNSFLSRFEGMNSDGSLKIAQSTVFNQGKTFGPAANTDFVRKKLRTAFGTMVGDISKDQPAETYQVEIFSPPYLSLPGARPEITLVNGQMVAGINRGLGNSRVSYNSDLRMRVTNAAAGGKVVLVKLGAVTHAMDVSQKLIVLSSNIQPNVVGDITVRTPIKDRDGGGSSIAPPGFYMLFYVSPDVKDPTGRTVPGKPSVARMVQLAL